MNVHLFGKSNDEKFFDMIDQNNFLLALSEHVERIYGKYEHLRQTWKDAQKSTGIYYKIQKGEYLTEKDIDGVKKAAANQGIVVNDPNYKLYIDVLDNIKTLGERIQFGPEDGDCAASQSEQPKRQSRIAFTNIASIDEKNLQQDMDTLFMISQRVEKSIKTGESIIDLPDTPTIDKGMVESLEKSFEKYVSYLEGVEKLDEKQQGRNYERNKIAVDEYRNKFSDNKKILAAAKQLTDFFYGANNFYLKGAQKVIVENKALFDLALKCDEKRYKKMLTKKKNEMYENIKNTHMLILKKLIDVAIDAYGRNHKLVRALDTIQKCYNI